MTAPRTVGLCCSLALGVLLGCKSDFIEPGSEPPRQERDPCYLTNSCGSDNQWVPSELTRPGLQERAARALTCQRNSDCTEGLVCKDGSCTEECAEDRDCAEGQSCVSGAHGFGVCEGGERAPNAVQTCLGVEPDGPVHTARWFGTVERGDSCAIAIQFESAADRDAFVEYRKSAGLEPRSELVEGPDGSQVRIALELDVAN